MVDVTPTGCDVQLVPTATHDTACAAGSPSLGLNGGNNLETMKACVNPCIHRKQRDPKILFILLPLSENLGCLCIASLPAGGLQSGAQHRQQQLRTEMNTLDAVDSLDGTCSAIARPPLAWL